MFELLNRVYKKIRFSIFAPIPEARENKAIKDRTRKVRYVLFGHFPVLGRKRSYGETEKSRARRKKQGYFDKYCQGKGLDIGYGGDPVVDNVTGWDFEHGDAQYLRSLEDEQFDFVYSSHLLEHLPDVRLSLTNWWRVLKPDGYLLLYLPHRDLYEKKKQLPSQFNTDHMHFFMPEQDELPDTLGVKPLIESVLENSGIIYCKVCDAGYKNPGDGLHSEGEFSIEVVVKKSSKLDKCCKN